MLGRYAREIITLHASPSKYMAINKLIGKYILYFM